MNREQQAQHIFDILRAEFDGETIMYHGVGQPFPSLGFKSGKMLNMIRLLDEPERYSIKKEPRTVDVRLWFHLDGDGQPEDKPFNVEFPTRDTVPSATGMNLIYTTHTITLDGE